MRFRRTLTAGLLLVIALSVDGRLLFGHHSVTGYDSSKESQLRGTVVELRWRNPHIFVVWDVKDSDGKIVQWTGEMNSPFSMMAAGMNRNSLKPGDEVIVSVNPSKSGNPNGVVRKITMADGKVVVDRFMPQ